MAQAGAKRTSVVGKASQRSGRRGHGGRIAWVPTLAKGRPASRADVQWQAGQAHAPPLWLIVVDTSASTRRHGALSRAKGFLQALFDQAYRQRARLALITASGAGAQWQRHGLKASRALGPWLDQLGAGGGTPLPEALSEAKIWLARQQSVDAGRVYRCVVITDGRLKTVQGIQSVGCDTLLVDMELGAVRLGKGRELARLLQADYVHLDALPPG